MDIDPLESFLVIAEEGHLTRAARRRHLTQPAVSAQLAKLEAELGMPLFHRTPKGMLLTEAGRLYRGYVTDALLRLDDGREALRGLAGLERGAFSVGGGATATTYLLPGLLRVFHDRHPAIRIFVREQGSRGVVDAVLRGDLDLGLVTLPIDVPSSTRTPLEVVPWVEDELQLIAPPGHPLRRGQTFAWSALRGQPMVLFQAGTAVRRLIDSALEDAGVQPQIVMELRSIESIKQMVAQGIGAGFVSRFAVGDGGPGLRAADGPLQRELAIVYRSDRALSAAANAFLSLIREPASLRR